MGFQGYLTDGNGEPRGGSNPENLKITFTIYDALSAGKKLWSEEQTVTVDKGHFSVILGITSQKLLDDLAPVFRGNLESGRYIGIKVDNEDEISPRIQFLAAPFAQHARYASELVGGTDVIATVKDGNLELGAGIETFQLQVSGMVTSKSLAISGNANLANATITNLNVEGGATFKKSGEFQQGLNVRSTNSILFGPNDGTGFRIGYNLKNGDALKNGYALDILGADNKETNRWLNISADVRIGSAESAEPRKIEQPGWGKAILFSGAPLLDLNTDRDNGDVIGMARYNVESGKTQLRTVLGSEANSTNDSWVLGVLTNNKTFPSNTDGWSPRLAIDSLGNIRFRPDLPKGEYNGTIGYNFNSSTALDIIGAGNSVETRKLQLHGATTIYGTLQASSSATVSGSLQIGGPVTITGSVAPESLKIKFRAWLGKSGTGINLGNPEWKQSDSELQTDVRPAPGFGLQVAGGVLANYIVIPSDGRIKEVLGASKTEEDLAVLSRIQISNYQYRDQVGFDPRPQKKVIAQQVEEVYPLAVSRSTGVVPDIFRKGRSGKGWLSVAADLSKGDRVRVVTSKGEAIYAIREVDSAVAQPGGDRRYRLEPALDDGEVFVYGREVDDFRSVDYEAIAMLNVSATQELAKRQERQESEIRELRERLSSSQQTSQALSRALSERDERLERLENQLAKLTAMLSGRADVQVAGLLDRNLPATTTAP